MLSMAMKLERKNRYKLRHLHLAETVFVPTSRSKWCLDTDLTYTRSEQGRNYMQNSARSLNPTSLPPCLACPDPWMGAKMPGT